MIKIINTLFVLIIPGTTLLNLYAQYPFEEAHVQHFINGTVGEERGGRTRYHYGIDFAKPGGTRVYSIEGGHMQLISGYPAIGHFGYLHITNFQFRIGEWIPPHTYIGDVNYQDRHLHLQQNLDDLSDNPVNTWESGNNWLNPIFFLQPQDSEQPRIDYVKLYRDQNQNLQLTNNKILFGKIDILVNTEDQRINPDGSGAGFGIAPYSIECDILDEKNQSIYKLNEFNFYTPPPNKSALTVHGPNANYNIPDFEYWITHDQNVRKYDRFLNFRQKHNASYLAEAACPEECIFKDGNITFKIVSTDYSNNQIEFNLPESGMNHYIIDNFQPYIQSVHVLIDGINIYSAQWDCGTTGPQFSGYECVQTQVDPNSIITIKISTSEKLISLRGRIVEFPGGFVDFYNQNGLDWICSFQNFNFLKDGDVANLEFSGSDQNGNQLLDLRAMSSGSIKFKQSIQIPVRESNSTWKPARRGGDIDKVHKFCFKSCDKLKKRVSDFSINGSDCLRKEDLEVSYEMESFNGAEDAWIHLNVSGGVAPYYMTWTDEKGVLDTQGINLFELSDLKSGTYCYTLIDDHCCEISGCIIICPSIILEVTSSVNHPSECGKNDGSIRIINRKISFGVPPYSFYLEDIYGNVQELSEFSGIYENLSEGLYTYKVRDAQGCEGSYAIELIGDKPIYLNTSISHACNGSDGSINVEAFSSDYPDDLYHFIWSTGDEDQNATESSIQNLEKGTYCLQIISSTNSCLKESCFKIDHNGRPLSLRSTSIIPCFNSSNGEIQIFVSGGAKPYTYKWSNNEFRSINKNLTAKEYCVTITDNCNNTFVKCMNLSNALKIKSDIVYNCPDNADITTVVTGGNPPYTYLWSDGNMTGTRSNLKFGKYSVTVTDKAGCSITDHINLNPIEFINPVKPCKGFWDGKITILIQNPNNEKVDVEYDYSPCDECAPFTIIRNNYSNPIQLNLDNLSGSRVYHFYVRIGSCLFEIKFMLGEEDFEEKFVRFDESSGNAYCVYDLICRETLIKDGKRKDPILTHKGGNCKKLLFKECSNVEVSCEKHAGILKTIPGKKVHMRRLEVILYAQKMGFDASSLSGNFCDHLWICHEDPFCIAAKLGGEFGGKFKGISRDGNCYKVKCRSFFGLINQDYRICDESFIPKDFLPFFKDERPSDESGGSVPRKECTPLSLNFTDVMECWSKFVMEDGKKFYDSQLAKLINNYRDKKERYCAWVTFCLEDYSILKTNLSELKCRNFNPPVNVGNWLVNSTCTPHTYNGHDIVFCECNDPDIIEKYGICLEPKQLTKSCTITFKQPVESRHIQILPFQFGNTSFSNFSTVYQSEGFTTINGLFKNQNDKYFFQKFEPGILINTFEPFDNALFAHHNLKHDLLYLVLKGSEHNSCQIYSGNLNSIDNSALYSDRYLNIKSFYPYLQGFIMSGDFSGHLYFNQLYEAYSEHISSFIFYRNDISNTKSLNIISSVQNSDKGQLHIATFTFVKSDPNDVVKLNGIPVHNESVNNCFQFTVDTNGNVSHQLALSISGNFSILNVKTSVDGSDHYILAKTKGDIRISNTLIRLDTLNQLVLVKWTNAGLAWFRNFNQEGIDIESISLESITNYGIALGLNVDSKANLFNSSQNESNYSSKDFVILQYDNNGNKIYVNRFGSERNDEFIKALYYSEEHVLYLGGDITGSESINTLGDLDILLANSLTHSGFISYIDLNRKVEAAQQMEREHEEITNLDSLKIRLYPNPVSDKLTISWQGSDYLTLEIYDLNSKLRFSVQKELPHKIGIPLSDFESGVYIVRIMDTKGKFINKRFVKM